MSFPRYPKYKDSGVEWLGEVPEHWEFVRLKHCVRLVTAKADQRCNPVALENIEGWTGRLITTEGDYQGDGTAFEAGDILFGKLRPYLAKVHLASQPGEAVGDFHVLHLNEEIDGHFVQYLMLTREFIGIVDGSTYGSKMPRASWEFLGGMSMVVPPPAEQTAIAAFLDRETAKIDALIAEQQRLIELLQEKRQAVISHAVTKGLNPDVPMKDSGIEWLGEVPEHWEESRIDRVSDFVNGKAHEPFVDDDGNFICVNSRFISTNGEAVKMCNENLTPAQHDDVLMVMSDLPNGRALARTFHVRDGGQYAINQRVCAIRANAAFPRFLFYLLNRNPWFLQRDDGLNQTHLPSAAFRKMPLFLQPLTEQQRIAERLDRVEKNAIALATDSENAITLLQERRSALISAAVTGQIDVRGLAGSEAA